MPLPLPLPQPQPLLPIGMFSPPALLQSFGNPKKNHSQPVQSRWLVLRSKGSLFKLFKH
jgi:hypothetical protein